MRNSETLCDIEPKINGDRHPPKGRGKGKKAEIFDLNIALSAIEKFINDIKTNYITEKGYVSALAIRENM